MAGNLTLLLWGKGRLLCQFLAVRVGRVPWNKLHTVLPHWKDCTTCPQTNRRDCDILTTHWTLLCYPVLFIAGRGVTSVHPMWWATNCRTYFTFLFWFCWDKRDTFYSSITTDFISKGTIGKHLLTFWKKSIFLTEYKVADLFWFCLCFPIFFKACF